MDSWWRWWGISIIIAIIFTGMIGTIVYLHYFPIHPPWMINRMILREKELMSTQTTLQQQLQQQLQLHHPLQTQPYNFWIVTACSTNHFDALQYMVYSIQECGRKENIPNDDAVRLIVYDLGLTVDERKILDTIAITEMGPQIEIRTFDYEAYPKHFDVHKDAGQYAWKPAIIYTVAKEMRQRLETFRAEITTAITNGEQPLLLVWIDAAAFFERLDIVREKVMRAPQGVYVGQDDKGTVRSDTDPAMYEWFGDSIERYSERAAVEAGMIGLRADNDKVMRDILEPWFQCACARECIAPPYSRRGNHTQDQSVLTYLVHRNGIDVAPIHGTIPGLDGYYFKCDRTLYRYLPTYPSIETYKYMCFN